MKKQAFEWLRVFTTSWILIAQTHTFFKTPISSFVQNKSKWFKKGGNCQNGFKICQAMFKTVSIKNLTLNLW